MAGMQLLTTARFCSVPIAAHLKANSLSLFCSLYGSTKQRSTHGLKNILMPDGVKI
jgi:hypothetical protein